MVMQRSILAALTVVAMASSVYGQFNFPPIGGLFGGLIPTAPTVPTVPTRPGAPQSPTQAPAQPNAGGLLGGIFGNLIPGMPQQPAQPSANTPNQPAANPFGGLFGGLLGSLVPGNPQSPNQPSNPQPGADLLGGLLGSLVPGSPQSPNQPSNPQPGANPLGGLFGGLLGSLVPGSPQSPNQPSNQPGAGLLGSLLGSLVPGGAQSPNQPGLPSLLQLLAPALSGASTGSQPGLSPTGPLNLQSIFAMMPISLPCPKINTTAAKTDLSITELRFITVPKLVAIVAQQIVAAWGEQATLQLPKSLTNDQQVKDFWTRFNTTNQKIVKGKTQFADALDETISRICKSGADKVIGAATTASTTKRDLPNIGLDSNCSSLLPAGLYAFASNGSATSMAALQVAYTADSMCRSLQWANFATQLGKLPFDTMTSAEIRKVLEYFRIQVTPTFAPNQVEVVLRTIFMMMKGKNDLSSILG